MSKKAATKASKSGPSSKAKAAPKDALPKGGKDKTEQAPAAGVATVGAGTAKAKGGRGSSVAGDGETSTDTVASHGKTKPKVETKPKPAKAAAAKTERSESNAAGAAPEPRRRRIIAVPSASKAEPAAADAGTFANSPFAADLGDADEVTSSDVAPPEAKKGRDAGESTTKSKSAKSKPGKAPAEHSKSKAKARDGKATEIKASESQGTDELGESKTSEKGKRGKSTGAVKGAEPDAATSDERGETISSESDAKTSSAKGKAGKKDAKAKLAKPTKASSKGKDSAEAGASDGETASESGPSAPPSERKGKAKKGAARGEDSAQTNLALGGDAPALLEGTTVAESSDAGTATELPSDGASDGASEDDDEDDNTLAIGDQGDDEDEEELSEEEETRRYLKGIIEALLFASDKPLTGRELARAARIDKKRTMQLLADLRREYRRRGVNIVEVSGGFVLRSNPTYGAFVQKALALRPVKLSRAQLETLALIAYRQPITRPEIDDIRGVDSGQVLKGLADRDLIKMLGKKDEAGRPMLYGTTPAFLELFSLDSLKGLPSLREFTELSDDSREKFTAATGETIPGPVAFSDEPGEAEPAEATDGESTAEADVTAGESGADVEAPDGEATPVFDELGADETTTDGDSDDGADAEDSDAEDKPDAALDAQWGGASPDESESDEPDSPREMRNWSTLAVDSEALNDDEGEPTLGSGDDSDDDGVDSGDDSDDDWDADADSDSEEDDELR